MSTNDENGTEVGFAQGILVGLISTGQELGRASRRQGRKKRPPVVLFRGFFLLARLNK